MKISVKRKHIENGIRVSPWKCPIALAITEQYGNHEGVDSHFLTVQTVDYKLSAIAQQFITKFDKASSVKPFTFEIKGLKKEKTKSVRSTG